MFYFAWFGRLFIVFSYRMDTCWMSFVHLYCILSSLLKSNELLFEIFMNRRNIWQRKNRLAPILNSSFYKETVISQENLWSVLNVGNDNFSFYWLQIYILHSFNSLKCCKFIYTKANDMLEIWIHNNNSYRYSFKVTVPKLLSRMGESILYKLYKVTSKHDIVRKSLEQASQILHTTTIQSGR